MSQVNVSLTSCDVVIELVEVALPSVPDVVDAASGPPFELANKLCRLGSVGEPVSAISDIYNGAKETEGERDTGISTGKQKGL